MVHVPRIAAENPPPKNILSPPNVKPPAIVERFAFLSVLVMLKVNAARVPPWSGVFLEIRPRASHSPCESPTPARCGQLRPVLDDCQPAIALQLCPRSGPGTLPRLSSRELRRRRHPPGCRRVSVFGPRFCRWIPCRPRSAVPTANRSSPPGTPRRRCCKRSN